MRETFCLLEDANELTIFTTVGHPAGGESLQIKQLLKRTTGKCSACV